MTSGAAKPLKLKTIKWPEIATDEPGDTDSFYRRKGKLYKDIWRWTREEWQERARTFEVNPGSFYNAWWYLQLHPIYWRFWDNDKPQHMRNMIHDQGFDGIWMSVVRVCPETGRVEDDKVLNTKTEVWLETGEYAWTGVEKWGQQPGQHYHNYKIDCGGDTYEEAVIKLARNVHRHYGNDRRRCEPDFTRRKQEKADADKASGKRRWRVRYRAPYAHRCAHQWKPGFAGHVERWAAEQDAEKGTQ